MSSLVFVLVAACLVFLNDNRGVSAGRAAVQDQDHNCRFWGAIGYPLPDSLILDHLLTGEYSFQDLGGANPNGWGLLFFSPALYSAGWIGPAIARGGPPADNPHDARYAAAVTQCVALDPTCAIAHLRLSAGAHTGVPDPHPFWRDGIAFGHNGVVSSSDMITLIADDDPEFLTTHPPDYTSPNIDSELLLLYLLEQRELGVPGAGSRPGDPRTERGGSRSRKIYDVTRHCIFKVYDAGALMTAANCVIGAGDTLIGVRFDHNDEERYRLRYRRVGDAWVVASEPVGTDTTGWSAIPPKHLGVFLPGQDAKIVRIFPPEGPYLVLADTLIDDDRIGESIGNGDGDCDAGERIELILSLLNEGYETAYNSHATLSTADSLCEILDAYEDFGDIPPESVRACLEDFDFLLDPNCPDGHRIDFNLRIECDSAQAWDRAFWLDVHAPVIVVNDYRVDDLVGGNNNGRIEPGEQFLLGVEFRNIGSESIGGVSVAFEVTHPYVTVLQGTASLDTLAAGAGGYPSPYFGLTVSGECASEDAFLGNLTVTTANGYSRELKVPIPIGGFHDDVESGVGDWLHYPITGGYTDQWHRSNARNHTPGGLWSWKFGGTGTTNYSNFGEGALESQTVTLREHSWLRFQHRMTAEVSSAYPGYCYDGGRVEVSVNEGGWESIVPVGGYPYLIRNMDGTSPFPRNTPVYSGTFEWEWAVFELSGRVGQARFRFHFGSDDNNTREGWYIDDVEIFGADSLWSGVDDHPAFGLFPALGPARPNPGGPGLQIDFRLPSLLPVRLNVYDVGGRVVRGLIDGRMAAGVHGILWDGCDDRGRELPAGSYFCRFECGQTKQTKRLVLMR